MREMIYKCDWCKLPKESIMEILIEDEAAIVPIFQENNVFLVSTKLKGFTPNKMGEYRLADVRYNAQ